MEAAAWTAIGLLGAVAFGSYFYLGGRIDALAARLDAKIHAVGSDLGARIDAQGAGLGARIDSLTSRLDDHVRQHAG